MYNKRKLALINRTLKQIAETYMGYFYALNTRNTDVNSLITGTLMKRMEGKFYYFLEHLDHFKSRTYRI